MTTMISDSVSYLAGRHSFKFGGEYHADAVQHARRVQPARHDLVRWLAQRPDSAHFRATSARARSPISCSASRYEASIVVGQFGRGYRQSHMRSSGRTAGAPRRN